MMTAKSKISSDTNKQPTVAFATVGCRLNQAESEATMESFSAKGYSVVDFKEKADIYYINTCTVTGKADRSSRQLIHRARRNNEEALVIAAGCFANAAAQELADSGEVDLVLGVAEKSDVFKYLENISHNSKPVVKVNSFDKISATAVGTRFSGRSRAFLKVQDGCDHACTYCAVTIARGPSRSAPLQEIDTALTRIRQAGFDEVVFTGVDLSAWGHDLDNSGDYISLVELAAEKGLTRIRVSSIEPWEITPQRVQRLAAVEAWCEHFHLALQSGSDNILKRMGRSTDLGILRESLAELLRLRPDSTIGADIISGFPGESEEDFQHTLKFLDDGPLHYLHVFPFSAREGTPAADYSDQVDRKIIQQRAQVLREESKKRRRQKLESMIGKNNQLLVETDGKSGYIRNYLRLRLEDGNFKQKSLVEINITGIDSEKELLYGRRI